MTAIRGSPRVNDPLHTENIDEFDQTGAGTHALG